MDGQSDVHRRLGGILSDLNRTYSPVALEVRAENAFAMTGRLFQLIRQMIPDEEDQKRLISSWLKSSRDGDFKKFRRTLRRYDRIQKGEPVEGSDDPIDTE